MSRAAVPSVSRKVGSGRSHGTPSEDEQREGGRKQLFTVFSRTSLAAHLCFCTLSVVFSEAVISFCHAIFFLFCFIWWGLFQTREPLESCCRHGLDRKFALLILS